LSIEDGDETDGLMDMLLSKKRAPDRKSWLEASGDEAEVLLWRRFSFAGRCVFAITPPIDGNPASHGNGSSIGFAAKDPAQANDGGVSCEDAPSIRDGRAGKLYLACLRDPSGNKLCALHRLVSA